MQKTAYHCDGCQEAIGVRKHISMSFGPYSGIANPPNKETSWTVVQGKLDRFVHFHGLKCLNAYFGRVFRGLK